MGLLSPAEACPHCPSSVVCVTEAETGSGGEGRTQTAGVMEVPAPGHTEAHRILVPEYLACGQLNLLELKS